MKPFSTFLNEFYHDMLLIEGKGQHQLLKQMGGKIIDRLLKEYDKRIKEHQQNGMHVVFTDPMGTIVSELPREGTPHIKVLHPEYYSQKFAGFFQPQGLSSKEEEKQIENQYQILAKEMGIPEAPEDLDLKNSTDATLWNNSLNWILKRYGEGSHDVDAQGNEIKKGIHSVVEIPRILDSLKEFHSHVKSGKLKSNVLHNYHNAEDLYKSMRVQNPFGGEGLRVDADYDVVGENRFWKILRTITPQSNCVIGKNTNWCTTGEYFDTYNDRGPIIIMEPKDPGSIQIRGQTDIQRMGARVPEKYQLHYETSQFTKPDQSQWTREEVLNFLKKPLPPGVHSKMVHDLLQRQYPEEYHSAMQELQIPEPDVEFKEKDVPELINAGHIRHVIQQFPEELTGEKMRELLHSTKLNQGTQEAVLEHALNPGRQNISKYPAHKIVDQELLDHMVANGYGKAVHKNLDNLEGVQDQNREYIFDAHVLNKNIAKQAMHAYLSSANPSLQHQQTISHLIDAFGHHAISKSPDRNPLLNMQSVQQMLLHPDRSPEHQKLVRKMILQGDFIDREDAAQIIPLVANHPSATVKTVALGKRVAEHAPYSDYLSQEQVGDIINQFFKTKFPQIRRVVQGEPTVEDTSSKSAKDIMIFLNDQNQHKHREYARNLLRSPEFFERVMDYPHRSIRKLYIDSSLGNDLPEISDARLHKLMIDEPDVMESYLAQKDSLPHHQLKLLSAKGHHTIIRSLLNHINHNANSGHVLLGDEYNDTLKHDVFSNILQRVDVPNAIKSDMYTSRADLPPSIVSFGLDHPEPTISKAASKSPSLRIEHFRDQLQKEPDFGDFHGFSTRLAEMVKKPLIINNLQDSDIHTITQKLHPDISKNVVSSLIDNLHLSNRIGGNRQYKWMSNPQNVDNLIWSLSSDGIGIGAKMSNLMRELIKDPGSFHSYFEQIFKPRIKDDPRMLVAHEPFKAFVSSLPTTPHDYSEGSVSKGDRLKTLMSVAEEASKHLETTYHHTNDDRATGIFKPEHTRDQLRKIRNNALRGFMDSYTLSADDNEKFMPKVIDLLHSDYGSHLHDLGQYNLGSLTAKENHSILAATAEKVKNLATGNKPISSEHATKLWDLLTSEAQRTTTKDDSKDSYTGFNHSEDLWSGIKDLSSPHNLGIHPNSLLRTINYASQYADGNPNMAFFHAAQSVVHNIAKNPSLYSDHLSSIIRNGSMKALKGVIANPNFNTNNAKEIMGMVPAIKERYGYSELSEFARKQLDTDISNTMTQMLNRKLASRQGIATTQLDYSDPKFLSGLEQIGKEYPRVMVHGLLQGKHPREWNWEGAGKSIPDEKLIEYAKNKTLHPNIRIAAMATIASPQSEFSRKNFTPEDFRDVLNAHIKNADELKNKPVGIEEHGYHLQDVKRGSELLSHHLRNSHEIEPSEYWTPDVITQMATHPNRFISAPIIDQIPDELLDSGILKTIRAHHENVGTIGTDVTQALNSTQNRAHLRAEKLNRGMR